MWLPKSENFSAPTNQINVTRTATASVIATKYVLAGK
jgi:hypothetical protein